MLMVLKEGHSSVLAMRGRGGPPAGSVQDLGFAWLRFDRRPMWCAHSLTRIAFSASDNCCSRGKRSQMKVRQERHRPKIKSCFCTDRETLSKRVFVAVFGLLLSVCCVLVHGLTGDQPPGGSRSPTTPKSPFLLLSLLLLSTTIMERLDPHHHHHHHRPQWCPRHRSQ
jgi:hypothetical protein